MVFNIIILQAVYTNSDTNQHCFFLDGQAGTKKMFVYLTIAHTVGGKGDSITPVASSGIAASLLAGGRHTHSTFKLSLLLNGTSTCNLNRNTREVSTLI
jgi:hypothetical protein